MKIKANGISMNYELSGSGRCFTLIHGTPDNLNVWRNQVRAFSRRYRVLTYDVRGLGQTEFPEGEPSKEMWVEDLYALLKALNISQTILLGYSMGGSIALDFTVAHPGMVSALILSNTLGVANMTDEWMREMATHRQSLVEAVKKEGMEAAVRDTLSGTFTSFSPGFVEKNPETIKWYRQVVLKSNPQAFLRLIQRRGRFSPTHKEVKITCPTLIITGEHDRLSGPPTAAKTTQEAIPGSQVKVLPTGHASAIEKPETFNEAVLTFLTNAGVG